MYCTGSDLTLSSFIDCIVSTSLFSQAVLNKVDFSGSNFTDVFFTSADLAEAKFIGTKWLKPIYFYSAKNLDKAIFEPEFKMELEEEFVNITEDEFKEYVNEKSELSKIRKEELFETLNQLAKEEG